MHFTETLRLATSPVIGLIYLRAVAIGQIFLQFNPVDIPGADPWIPAVVKKAGIKAPATWISPGKPQMNADNADSWPSKLLCPVF